MGRPVRHLHPAARGSRPPTHPLTRTLKETRKIDGRKATIGHLLPYSRALQALIFSKLSRMLRPHQLKEWLPNYPDRSTSAERGTHTRNRLFCVRKKRNSAGAASSVAWLGPLVTSGGLGWFLPCSVGRQMSRLRHFGVGAVFFQAVRDLPSMP